MACLGASPRCNESHGSIRDKREFLRDMAFNAAVAAESGDSRQSFRIIRLLGGFSPRKPKSVLLEDGSVAQDYVPAGS